MADAFAAAGRGRPLLVVGGPRFDPGMAPALGVDKIFGRGTTPREVASYLVHTLAGPGDGAGDEPEGEPAGAAAGQARA
jgi:beta-lysine 5,6-aminomutase beta subunit